MEAADSRSKRAKKDGLAGVNGALAATLALGRALGEHADQQSSRWWCCCCGLASPVPAQDFLKPLQNMVDEMTAPQPTRKPRTAPKAEAPVSTEDPVRRCRVPGRRACPMFR